MTWEMKCHVPNFRCVISKHNISDIQGDPVARGLQTFSNKTAIYKSTVIKSSCFIFSPWENYILSHKALKVVAWTRSTYLTPPGRLMWGQLKAKVYTNKPRTTNYVREAFGKRLQSSPHQCHRVYYPIWNIAHDNPVFCITFGCSLTNSSTHVFVSVSHTDTHLYARTFTSHLSYSQFFIATQTWNVSITFLTLVPARNKKWRHFQSS
jgi:hypothetical protein